MPKKYLKIACVLALLAAPMIGFADDDDDARLATKQVRDGVILSLTEILARIHHITEGQILEIELEREDQGLVYEVYFLDADGRRREIYVDAGTGELLVKIGTDEPDATTSD